VWGGQGREVSKCFSVSIFDFAPITRFNGYVKSDLERKCPFCFLKGLVQRQIIRHSQKA
jgi:hypothetical protein